TDPSRPITLSLNTLQWKDPLPEGRSTYFKGGMNQVIAYCNGKVYVGRQLSSDRLNFFKTADGSVYFRDAQGIFHFASKDGGSRPLTISNSVGSLIAWHETEDGEGLLLHNFI